MRSLFDLIAPIAIYHGADVTFKPQAMAAAIELQRRARLGDKALAGHGFLHPNNRTANYLDYLEDEEPYTDSCHLPNVQDLYVELFKQIVEDEQPDWTCFFDRWGARAYKDEAGKLVFSGDSSWRFPWYETEDLLRERIREHVIAEAA